MRISTHNPSFSSSPSLPPPRHSIPSLLFVLILLFILLLLHLLLFLLFTSSSLSSSSTSSYSSSSLSSFSPLLPLPPPPPPPLSFLFLLPCSHSLDPVYIKIQQNLMEKHEAEKEGMRPQAFPLIPVTVV